MQKRQVVKSDSKPVKFFLTLEGTRGTNGKITKVNLFGVDMSRPDNLGRDQTCFELKLDVPVSAFEVPVYDMKIDQAALIPDEMIAEVKSWVKDIG